MKILGGRDFNELTRLRGSSTRHPDTSLWIHLVDLVVLHRGATIVLGPLPLEFASLVVHIGHFQGPFRCGRLVGHDHVDGDHVLSGGVGGGHGVLAGVLSARWPDHQLGVVVGVVDGDPLATLDGVGGQTPVDVWWRFTDDVGVELERASGGNGDVTQVAPVDLRSHCKMKFKHNFKILPGVLLRQS